MNGGRLLRASRRGCAKKSCGKLLRRRPVIEVVNPTGQGNRTPALRAPQGQFAISPDSWHALFISLPSRESTVIRAAQVDGHVVDVTILVRPNLNKDCLECPSVPVAETVIRAAGLTVQWSVTASG